MSEKKVVVVGSGKGGTPEKIIKLFSQCKTANEMQYITSNDIRFVHKDEFKKDQDSMSACIQWPSGQWQYGRLNITNKNLQKAIDDSIGGFGPTHVRISHHNHYGTKDGPSAWLISFLANSILAQRYALMTDRDFTRLCGKLADWDKLMRGEEGRLPSIH